MHHGKLWPEQHGEQFGGQLECRGPDQPGGLLAHPDEEVGVAVEDVDTLGVQHLLLDLVTRHLHLGQLQVAHSQAYGVQTGNGWGPVSIQVFGHLVKTIGGEGRGTESLLLL